MHAHNACNFMGFKEMPTLPKRLRNVLINSHLFVLEKATLKSSDAVSDGSFAYKMLFENTLKSLRSVLEVLLEIKLPTWHPFRLYKHFVLTAFPFLSQ